MGNKKYTDTIEFDVYYHIFNRGINGQVIFKQKSNYSYFLNKLEYYLFPIAELYAYCLIPNHFHLLVRMKSETEIAKLQNSTSNIPISFLQKQFSNFFNSYAQSFNKQENRTGKLFDLPYRRKRISTQQQLISTVIYIHRNPLKHKLIADFTNYPFSSYKKICSQNPKFVKGKEVISWFDDIENFIFTHNQP
ncbi:hypothetical protein [Moheibacter stercoris]|uniref:REP element-mobilizing transposase RayT n=1 Tax=Moheibacter stercoris TaxID=1628251 RepID=A0ABV2LUR7_9FLAO